MFLAPIPICFDLSLSFSPRMPYRTLDCHSRGRLLMALTVEKRFAILNRRKTDGEQGKRPTRVTPPRIREFQMLAALPWSLSLQLYSPFLQYVYRINAPSSYLKRQINVRSSRAIGRARSRRQEAG